MKGIIVYDVVKFKKLKVIILYKFILVVDKKGMNSIK